MLNWNKPLLIQLDLTNKCNLNCIYCYNNINKNAEGELSDSNVIKIAKSVLRLSPRFVVLSGGEPFLREKLLFKLLDLFNEHNILTKINTNGTLLNLNTIKKLQNYKKITLAINLESSSAEEHEKIRGSSKGTFNRTIRNIKLLVNKLGGNKIWIATVVFKQNYKRIKSIFYLVKKLGVKYYQLIDFVPTNLEMQKYLLNESDWREVYEVYKKLEKDPATKIIPNHALLFLKHLGQTFPFCMAGKFKLLIDAKGNIFPCNFLRESWFLCGNALEKDVGKIWKSSETLKFFRFFKPTNKKCINCSNLAICMGGCRALAYYINGDLSAADPYCGWFKNG
jgi:radical SAM protein with 4Fe4S-binding SPASM domain